MASSSPTSSFPFDGSTNPLEQRDAETLKFGRDFDYIGEPMPAESPMRPPIETVKKPLDVETPTDVRSCLELGDRYYWMARLYMREANLRPKAKWNLRMALRDADIMHLTVSKIATKMDTLYGRCLQKARDEGVHPHACTRLLTRQQLLTEYDTFQYDSGKPLQMPTHREQQD